MAFLVLLLEATGTLLACLVLFYYVLWKAKTRRDTNAPQPKGAWPIIGHLHLLGGKTLIFRTLAAMADKHGPVFAIQIGMRTALVVSSKETIRECCTTNDRAFLTRPKAAASKYLAYNYASLAFTPHGPYWRELRKVTTLELLSNSRLELMKSMRAEEVSLCISELYALCVKQLSGVSERLPGATKVDMSHWLGLVTMNLMLRAIAGRRFALSDGENDARFFTEVMHKYMYFIGCFEFSDVIPYIEWMDLQGNKRAMKQSAEEVDRILSKWLEEHVQSGKNGLAKEERQDFMDVLLSSFPYQDSVEHGHYCRNIVKATVLTMFIAGSDSTSTTMTWALSLLLNHNKHLKLVQHELDTHVGKERWVEESDIKDLIYFQAVVNETLRLYPPGPIWIPRESTEDCHVAGFFVPKGTRLIVNAWKLHRDPRVWIDPDEFQPERFLDKNIVKASEREHEFEFLPFGSGRRSCPGEKAARLMMYLTLARLLQGFEITTLMNEKVDMSEGFEIVLAKATPLQVLLSPRLKPELYLQ